VNIAWRILQSKKSFFFRVAIWRTNVDCWLQKVNALPSFDVGVYKINLSNSIHETHQSTAEKVSFRDVVSGHSRSEVCRYFLTALLLCNEKKIIISPKDVQGSVFIAAGMSIELHARVIAESNFDILPVVSNEKINMYAKCPQSDYIFDCSEGKLHLIQRL
jgi:hypothetical protein